MNRRAFLAKCAVVGASLPMVGRFFKPRTVNIVDTKPQGDHFVNYIMDDLVTEPMSFIKPTGDTFVCSGNTLFRLDKHGNITKIGETWRQPS